MREIKFRGYNGTKWIYSAEISGIPCFDTITYFMPNEDNELNQEHLGNWDSVSYVGQYTGLKDKNGTEIYEGDIIQTKDFYECGELIFKGKLEVIKSLNDYISRCAFIDTTGKVIGNIYENPELLEGVE